MSCEAVDGEVKAVGVLHQKLACPKETAARPGLVAKLGLDLIDNTSRSAGMTAYRPRLSDRRRQFPSCVMPSTQSWPRRSLNRTHRGVDRVVATGSFPDVGVVHHRHQDFPRTGAFISSRTIRLDATKALEPEVEIRVDARGVLSHVAGAFQEGRGLPASAWAGGSLCVERPNSVE